LSRVQLEVCASTVHALTGTQPLASRGPNSSGAMYRGVPRGGVLTAPHPRPVGSGMARKARPKSLILADMETEPPASTELTHRTCLQGWGKGRQLPPSEWNNHTGIGCTNESDMRRVTPGCSRRGQVTHTVGLTHVAWLQVCMDVAPVVQKRHARCNTTGNGHPLATGFPGPVHGSNPGPPGEVQTVPRWTLDELHDQCGASSAGAAEPKHLGEGGVKWEALQVEHHATLVRPIPRWSSCLWAVHLLRYVHLPPPSLISVV
jgi:hypothetical protein